MIRRAPGCLGIHPIEPKLGQIQCVDKNADDANRIVFADPVLQAFRKQSALNAIRPFDEAPHPILPQIARESYRENQIQRCVFTQPRSLGDSAACPRYVRSPPIDGVIGRPAFRLLEILGAALQADGETRSAFAASSIRRRSAAWTILPD